MILAYRIEKKLSKEEILYLYLNQIYLGDGAYGVEAAAQTYFSRGVSSLTVAEGALLAGLAQAPTRYSPRGHIDKARARQRYVLRRMAEVGFLDKDAAEKAYEARLALAPPSTFRSKAAYFLEHVRNYLQEKYGADAMYRSEFRIYTTIDGRLQEAAYDAVTQGVRRIEEANKYQGLQGALLCMDPGTGGVLAMVGGVDFGASQFNRALQARRQPGSAFKPVVYGAALDKGKTLVSTVDDSPIEFARSETEMWKPKNYDDTFLGPIPLLEALAKSRNLATVRLLNEIGVDTAIGMARDLGIQSPIERNLSIALGSSGVTPLEMVTAYSTFAAGGQRPTPFFIREVQDGQGHVLERTEPKVVQAIAPETAYLTIRLMQEVLRTGTGASAARALAEPRREDGDDEREHGRLVHRRIAGPDRGGVGGVRHADVAGEAPDGGLGGAADLGALLRAGAQLRPRPGVPRPRGDHLRPRRPVDGKGPPAGKRRGDDAPLQIGHGAGDRRPRRETLVTPPGNGRRPVVDPGCSVTSRPGAGRRTPAGAPPRALSGGPPRRRTARGPRSPFRRRCRTAGRRRRGRGPSAARRSPG